MILFQNFTKDFYIHSFIIIIVIIIIRYKLRIGTAELFNAMCVGMFVTVINYTYFPKFSASAILFGRDDSANGEGFCGGGCSRV